ncbi:uncharacterized protein LOC125187225 isoform X2 [Salvia hispanica]|uniref:uncharacterized protein LOC125187225 isoform X2 n=1 Tax=Salvia hispanica TaxID=49212 RepID=UPI00200925B3|nr:uncharacterized protein LOC125187225 isoform X2 [Salvia hispanica]
MRMRDRKAAPDCSVSSSSSSSITAAHSFASSQDSSNSCQSHPVLPRCRGLDLLVKAIHQVDAGSVVGVPYIQRRVSIRRRRRTGRIEFDAFVFGRKGKGKGGGIKKTVSSNKKAAKGKMRSDEIGLRQSLSRCCAPETRCQN